MMATMRDVARHAGVAPSTVSYMLSGDKPVAAATRERIEQAMDALGYRPNAIARSLASRRTRILALHLPEFDVSAGETVFEIVRGAYDRAAERGYLLTVWPIAAERAPQELSELVGRGHADAVLLVEVELDDPRVDSLHASGIPFLSVGRTRENAQLHFVDIDFEATIDQALEALTATGHRDVMLLGRSRAMETAGYGPAVRSHEDFARLAVRRGLGHREHALDPTPQAGRDLARTVFAGADRPGADGTGGRPDAVVAMNDLAVVGFVNELQVMGFDLPRDLSILSVVSNRRTASLTAPSLTAWQAPGEEMGRRAVDALLDQLADPHAPPTQVLVACTRYDGDSLGDRRAAA